MLIEFLLDITGQIIVSVLVFKAMNAFAATKQQQSKSKDPKIIKWTEAETVVEKMETRLSALQRREMDAKERVWILEDENTVLRFKLIEAQKRAAGEAPDQPNYHADDE